MSDLNYKVSVTKFYQDKELDTLERRDRKGTVAEQCYNAIHDDIWGKIQGCCGCAFIDKEEWEMPCVKCKRICKDYYRDSEELKEQKQ